MALPLAERKFEVGCLVSWAVGKGGRTWKIPSLAEKEPELVCEVERYQLDIVGLTSTHSVSSATKLLESG